jgi:heme/copper-type cytochrome/quinol oxidase subunit 4
VIIIIKFGICQMILRLLFDFLKSKKKRDWNCFRLIHKLGAFFLDCVSEREEGR